MSIKSVLLTLNIGLVIVGCSLQSAEQYSAESFNVDLTIENAETGQPIPREEISIFYDLSSADRLFTSPLGEAMPEDQQSQTYTTDSNGQITTKLYGLEDASLAIEIGGTKYRISTSELESGKTISREEKDRITPWRSEIEYPINLILNIQR